MDAKARSTRVIEVASAYARQHGQATEGYVADAVQRGGEWAVSYRRPPGSKPAPGDFFTVFVDDRTLTASRLVPGK